MQNSMNNDVRPMRVHGFALLRRLLPEDGSTDHYVSKQGAACTIQRE